MSHCYTNKNGMDQPCHGPSLKSWVWNKNVIVLAAAAALWLVSYIRPELEPFRQSLRMYTKMIWWAIALGFLLGGIVERYVPKEYISLILASHRKRSLLYSVFLGFLVSACSHGVLALSIELHKKGASTPVVVSFLLASPWASLPITLMLIGFFGLKAVYIILGALAIALNTGLIFRLLERKGWIESNPNSVWLDKSFSIAKDIEARVKHAEFSWDILRSDLTAIAKGALSLADMTLWLVVIGIILSSLAAAFIPERLFHQYMGPTFLGLLATLALATVMEVCSQGTAPLAFQIYKMTGAFGNAFVFLMAGVVTDLTAIGLIWANVGRKTAFWIPVVAVPQVVLLGILANKIF